MSRYVIAEFGSEGPKGDSATVEVGTVTTLPAGSNATVTNSGDEHNAVFDFGIPKGDKGDKGDKGNTGAAGADGADGKSAYQQAVEGGYSGTEAQFEAALSGIDGYLPKVFDGEQTITPKTGNSSSLILSPNNDTSRFKIEFNGTGGHILNEKKINGTWKTIPTIRLDNNSGIEIKQIKDDETAESVITVKGNAGDGIKIQIRNTTSQELAAISLKNNSFEVKNTLGNGNTQLGKIGISANGAISLETVSTAKINGNDILTAADKGSNNGVASLGSDGKVPSAQLPDIDTLPSQTGNSGKFLTTDGTNPSWADVLPSFPAPSETVSTVAYTAAGGTSGILGKEIQSITFDSNDTAIFNPAISSGPETMACRIGRGSSYVPADDVLLTFNFTIYNNTVSYAELVATRNGSSLGSIAFITDLGNGPQFTPWDSNIWLGNGINVYWDYTNKKIVSDLNFKPASLTALGDAIDNVFVFETIIKNNALPAASAYANKLAYVYETGTYSDIKNLIYSDGTNWNFLPGAVLQIPDERMHDTVQRAVPAYCGIALKTGQLAIPARNKSDAIYPNYSIGQMHEFYVDSSNWLNRYWGAMNFGTIFHGNSQWLTQEDEYSWIPEVMPDIYSSYTFINNGQTAYTQTVKVNLLNSANFCQWVFAQGTNKIKLQFENATNAKVFLNGQEVNTANDLLLDADSKTYIADFYQYSDNSGYLVMDIKELPYNPVNKVIALSSSTATLATNTNYTATVSGSAAFTLPTPANTSFENTINILLTVSATTTVNWGVNVNSVLSSFAAGKYEIRFRYNNATDNWIGEVLEQKATPSHTKCFVSFNETYTDQTGNITLTPNFTPTYTDNAGYTAFEGVKSLQTATGSLDKGFAISDPNNVLTFDGTFTIALWVRIGSSTRNTAVFSGGTSNLRLEGTGTLTLASQTISGSTYLTNSMHYVEINRDSENKVRYFIDGTLQNGSNLKTISGTVKFSDSTLCFSSSMDASHCFQDFVITDQVGHTVNYDVPTAPYVISDNSLADLHDSIKQNNLTTITGYDSSKTQVLKNVQGVLTWVDEA